MITVYNHDDLGHAQTEWLDSHHHFSFGHYHNPKRRGFGNLRVVNDDIIRSGSGFGLHPHKNMEIITYVRKGTILHKDSMGNSGKIHAGDIQVMTAGKGITHCEYADADDPNDTVIYQIWIKPRERGLDPHWDQAEFPKNTVKQALSLLASGRAEDQTTPALTIQQDASIFGGRIEKSVQITQKLRGNKAYALASSGSVSINGAVLKEGDGAEIEDIDSVDINALIDAEILLIEL